MRKSKDADVLTVRQAQVLRIIRRTREKTGYSPTLTEIGEELGIGRNQVHGHVQALLHKGLLSYTPNRWRSLVPVERPKRRRRGKK